MVFDFSRYSWNPLAGAANHGSLIREAAGGELMEYLWRGFGLGDYVIIFMAELVFFGDVSQDILIQCMKHAWAGTRYDIPIVAAHTIYDEENRTRIIYRPARSAEEATDWASRTVRLIHGFDNIEEFRRSISFKEIRDENGDQTFLYVLPHKSSPGACSVLVHASHITFDTKGLHSLFTVFMKKLATAITLYPSAPHEKLEWGSEGKHVPPSPYDVLGDAEVRSGPLYDATLKSIVNDIMIASQYEHGLKPCPSSDYVHEVKRATFTLTADDSLNLFSKVKTHGLTVNHVCNAALMLACAEENPVPEEKLDSALFSYLLTIDGRPRLRPPFCNKDGYPGFCLGVSPVQIPAKALNGPHLKDDAERLIHASRLMKQQYAKGKEYPSLLAIAPERTEMMLRPFMNKNMGLIPPPTSTAPWYSGDGKGETYLDPIYVDNDGKKISEIQSIVTTVNKFDSAPFFRAWSWRDRLTVSVDYNPHAVPEETIERLLVKMRRLMTSLIQ